MEFIMAILDVAFTGDPRVSFEGRIFSILMALHIIIAVSFVVWNAGFWIGKKFKGVK
jgi:hypothetical protein